MRATIAIELLVDGRGGRWRTRFPLVPPGEEEPKLDGLEDEQLTDLVLGRVLDYVTAELL